MATAYIDVKVEPGIDGVAAIADTSTTTNDVRVSYQTALKREQVSRTLMEIAQAILDEESVKFPNSKFDV